jgi:ferredoxin
MLRAERANGSGVSLRRNARSRGESLKMADPHDKVPGQPSGKYYVDTQCIDCDLCRETAPANYMRNDEEGFSYVYKQPETPEEETLTKDALDNCPVEAIGSDGE